MRFDLHCPLCRNLDSASSEKLVFNVNRQEKGNKVVTTTEVLLELDSNDYIMSIIDAMQPDEPVRELLANVVSEDFLANFKTHFWGDVCILVAVNTNTAVQCSQ